MSRGRVDQPPEAVCKISAASPLRLPRLQWHTMGAPSRHQDSVHSIGQLARLLFAMWIIVAAAAQPVLAAWQPGPAGSTASQPYAPECTVLLPFPSGPPMLLEERRGDNDPHPQERGPQPRHALAGSSSSLELQCGSNQRGATPHRQRLSTRGRLHAPRAPPLMHG